MAHSSNSWNLLVIDPADQLAATIEPVIRDEGYAVVRASDPEEAYELFLAGSFDLVLADLPADEEASAPLLERFQQLSPDVPIILTAAEGDASSLETLQRGAFGVLHKPPSDERVRQILFQARQFRRLERQRTEALEAARANKKFYEDVLTGVNEGILVFDHRGRIRFRNAEATRILDADEADDDFDEGGEGGASVHKSVVSQILQLLASTLTEGTEARKMLVLEDEERRVHLEVTTSRLRGAAGETRGAIALLRDRSTEMLLEQQLVHSERLATLGGLLAGIAHDIHNPLSVITGCAEIGLEAGREAAEAARSSDEESRRAALEQAARDMQELFDQIQEAGLRCRSIANNLLAYSRRSTIRRDAIDINALLRKTVEFVGRYRKLEEIELEFALDPGLPRVHLEPTEIQQALTNLIDNAVQALEASSVKRLSIRTAALDRSVRIEIDDSGPGIPEKRLKRIFQPFFTTKKTGTGLGLHITRRVLEQQQGAITVTSREGEGTCFTVTLPLA